MALFAFLPVLGLSLQNTLQNTDSNSISVYSENNAYLNIYLYMINSTKMRLTNRRRFWGISMKISGFCGYGDSVGIPTGFCCGYGMGMGIEIQSPRQPCWMQNSRYILSDKRHNDNDNDSDEANEFTKA